MPNPSTLAAIAAASEALPLDLDATLDDGRLVARETTDPDAPTVPVLGTPAPVRAWTFYAGRPGGVAESDVSSLPVVARLTVPAVAGEPVSPFYALTFTAPGIASRTIEAGDLRSALVAASVAVQLLGGLA